ncbi:MAG: hypothetical protein AABZ15_07870 [Nitrospirota bacterium]
MVIIMCVFAGPALAGTSIIGSKHDFSFGSTGSQFSGQFQIGAPTDFGTLIDEICVFCHTPHGASTDAQTGTLLWNRISSPPSGYTYKTYSSGSMTIPAPDSLNSGKPTGISMMCMSCHDGVTSIAVNIGNNPITPTLLNAPGPGNPQVSIDQFSILPMPGAIGNIYNGGVVGWGANIGNANPGVGTTIDLSNDHPISFEWPTGKAGLEASPTNAALRLFGASGLRIECATCHLVHNPSTEPFLAMSNSQSLMCRACHIK